MGQIKNNECALPNGNVMKKCIPLKQVFPPFSTFILLDSPILEIKSLNIRNLLFKQNSLKQQAAYKPEAFLDTFYVLAYYKYE